MEAAPIDHRNYLRFTIPILLGLLLNSCSESRLATPSPTLSPVILSPTPDLGATEKPIRSLYTDREVETFIERFPRLAGSLDGDPVPEDILQCLEIDVDALRVIDFYAGACPTRTVYELSPSYDLVVDDNACFGYYVFIKQK